MKHVVYSRQLLREYESIRLYSNHIENPIRSLLADSQLL
jgi:hypothetical protein